MARLSPIELGQQVSRRRGSAGIRAAAAEIGISPATLSRVERGHVVDVATLVKVIKWLELDPREILGEIDRTERETSVQVVFKSKRALKPQSARALARLIMAAHKSFSESIESEGH